MGAIRALLNGIVDYAGLFPPARLPMPPVVSNFARYQAGPHAWMLGRLICPAGRLVEFADAFASQPATATAWHLSVLGRGGNDAAAFLDGCQQDWVAVDEAEARLGTAIQVDAFECKLPAALVESGSAAGVTQFAIRFADLLESSGRSAVVVAFEIPLAGDWARTVPAAIHGLAAAKRERDGARIVVKMRTGGVSAEMFPSVEQVACVITSCAREGVPFKATAGLHHPVRHYAELVSTKMHGFLNVFGGAILLAAGAIEEAVLVNVLADESLDSFQLSADRFAWRGQGASTAQITAARETLATSFGSCSFEEPIEDLQRWGVL